MDVKFRPVEATHRSGCLAASCLRRLVSQVLGPNQGFPSAIQEGSSRQVVTEIVHCQRSKVLGTCVSGQQAVADPR